MPARTITRLAAGAIAIVVLVPIVILIATGGGHTKHPNQRSSTQPANTNQAVIQTADAFVQAAEAESSTTCSYLTSDSRAALTIKSAFGTPVPLAEQVRNCARLANADLLGIAGIFTSVDPITHKPDLSNPSVEIKGTTAAVQWPSANEPLLLDRTPQGWKVTGLH
jgi:hypothetical protein